jgi:tRNA isopentenyl-2-thiomethyl-A-37 hydroxylase MiaE
VAVLSDEEETEFESAVFRVEATDEIRLGKRGGELHKLEPSAYGGKLHAAVRKGDPAFLLDTLLVALATAEWPIDVRQILIERR